MAYRSYNKIDYSISNKPRKRSLEAFNQHFIKDKGGIFALTGPEVISHYNEYGKILRTLSPFSIFEIDIPTYWDIIKSALIIDDKRLHIYPCDICNILYTSPKPEGKKHGIYRYGHLDFCITGKVLVRDHSLLVFLERLAKWDNLKSPFYLETTFSIRGEKGFKTGKNVGLSILENKIPNIFSRYGWRISSPRNEAIHKDSSVVGGIVSRYWYPGYTVSYKDGKNGCTMINGFHKFTRRRL